MERKFQYGIDFKANTSGLKDIQKELNLIQQFTMSDLKIVNKDATVADLNEIKSAAKDMERILQESFNPKLNTINLESFNQKIGQNREAITRFSEACQKTGDVGKQAFATLTTQLLSTKKTVKETIPLIDKLGETLGNTIKWKVSSTAIEMFTGSIRKAWGYTKKLDDSLNDIRIVTEKSAESMEKFAKQANSAAKGLGAATTNYTKAALIYYQQGLGEEDVQARTSTTIKAANVTGQSAADVSEQLTAVWNGYKVVAEEAELYIDKLAAVAATTAADLEELSTGMSKVASAANTMGVDIDQLSAQLSTIVSVTRQDASLVGTALKTIYARMGDLEVAGVDEFGTSLGDVSGKLRQMGIDVLDQEGNLRDMGTVIEEVAKKWKGWTDAQQQAAAVAIAGKRQYNNLIALFENWDMYESALTTSKTSAGTLQKQQDIYMESLEAHLNQLSVAGEKVYDALFDSDSMKDMIDFATLLVDQFGNLIDSIGGGGNMLLMFGSIAGKALGKQAGQAVSTLIMNFQNLRQNTRTYQAELDAVNWLQQENVKVGSKNAEKIIELRREQLKLEKNLTAEQKEQNRQRLIALGKVLEEKEATGNELSSLSERFQELQGQKDTKNKIRKTINLTDEGFEEGDSNEIIAKEKVDVKEKEIENLAAKEKEIQEKIESLSSNIQKTENTGKERKREEIKRVEEEKQSVSSSIQEIETDAKNVRDSRIFASVTAQKENEKLVSMGDEKIKEKIDSLGEAYVVAKRDMDYLLEKSVNDKINELQTAKEQLEKDISNADFEEQQIQSKLEDSAAFIDIEKAKQNKITNRQEELNENNQNIDQQLVNLNNDKFFALNDEDQEALKILQEEKANLLTQQKELKATKKPGQKKNQKFKKASQELDEKIVEVQQKLAFYSDRANEEQAKQIEQLISQQNQNILELDYLNKNFESSKKTELAIQNNEINPLLNELEAIQKEKAEYQKNINDIDREISQVSSADALSLLSEDSRKEYEEDINKVKLAEELRKSQYESNAGLSLLSDKSKNIYLNATREAQIAAANRQSLKKDSLTSFMSEDEQVTYAENQEKLQELKNERKEVESRNSLSFLSEEEQNNREQQIAEREELQKELEKTQAKKDIIQEEKVVADSEYQKVKDNQVSLNEAISITKNIAEYSTNLSSSAERAQGFLNDIINAQKVEAEYKQKYAIDAETPVDALGELKNVTQKLGQEGLNEEEKKKLQEHQEELNKLVAVQEIAKKSKKSFALVSEEVATAIQKDTTAGDKNNKLTQNTINVLIGVKKEMSNYEDILLGTAEVTEDNIENAEALAAALDKISKSSREGAEEAADLNEELISQQQENIQQEAEKARILKEQSDADRKDRISNAVKGITELSGAITSTIGIVKSFASTWETLWNDDSLTAGEKVAQLLLSFVSIGAAAIPTITSLVSGFKTLQSASKKSGDEMEKAGVKGFIAGLKAQAPWAWIIVIVAAIIAALALLAVAFDKIGDNGESAFNKASKSAEEAANSYNEIKAAYEDLKKSFENHNNAQKAIQDMIVGTEEWKEAIQDANREVLDLIDKYPELAQYVSDVNGQLVISKKGQEEILQKQNETVQMADRVRMTTQIEKLKAENSMNIQKGGNEALNTDAYAKWGVVTRIFASGVTDFGLTKESQKREEAFAAAVNMAAENNSILANKEAFTEAMNEAGFGEYANALWENKNVVSENSASLQANNIALDLYQRELAKSHLQDIAAYQNASDEDKKLIEQMTVQEIDKNSEAYQDALGKYSTKYRTSYRDWGKDYVEAIGGQSIVKDKTKNGVITYIDANGDEKAISAENAAAFMAEREVKGQITESTVKDQLNLIQDVRSMENGKVLSQFAGGRKTADLSNLTSNDLKGLSDKFKNDKTSAIWKILGFNSEEEFENTAKQLGYESGKNYAEAVQKSIKNYERTESNLLVGLDQSIKKAFDELDLSNYTLSTKKSVVNALEQAFDEGGTTGVNALKDVINNGGLTETELETFLQTIGDISWDSRNAISDLTGSLKQNGIEVNWTSETWKGLKIAISSCRDVVKEALYDFDGVLADLGEFNKIANNLNIGEAITKEDFEALTKYAPELKKFFIQTTEGFTYKGGAKDQLKEITNNFLNPEELNAEIEKQKTSASKVAESAFNNEFLKKNSKGKFSFTNEEEFSEKILGYGGTNAQDLLASIGTSQTDYQTSYQNSKGWTMSSFMDNKNFNDILNFNSVEDLARNYYGIAADGAISAEQLAIAKNAMEEARVQKEQGQKFINETNSKVLEIFNRTDKDWNTISTDQQASLLMSTTSSYDELNRIYSKEKVNEEAYNEAATTFLAQEAAQLGVNEKAWSDYVAKQGDSLEAQDKYLDNIRKIQSYDEVDYFSRLSNAISKANATIQKYSAEKNLSVAGSFDSEGIVDSYKDIEKAEEDRLKILREEASEIGSEMSSTYGIYDFSQENLDSVYDGYLAKYNEALSSGDENLQDYYKKAMDTVNNYSDVIIEQENTIAAEREAQLSILDTLISEAREKTQALLDLSAFRKEWLNFDNEYKDFSIQGLFGEKSVLDTITNTTSNLSFDLSESGQLGIYLDELRNMDIKNGYSYADYSNEAAYWEDYQNYLSGAKNSFEEIIDSMATLYESWTTAQEEIIALYDKSIERLSTVNSAYSGMLDLWKIIGKTSDRYSTNIKATYDKITANSLEGYQLAQEKVKTLTEEYNKTLKSGSQEAIDTAWNNLAAANEALASSATEYLSALSNEFSYSLESAFDDFAKNSGLGNSFNEMSENWEQEKRQDETYMDSVNSAYAIDNLERNIQKSIDTTDSLSAQRKLNDLKKQELEILEKKGKLSQYDIDRANAMYELTLKQIALEEAQQTANKMKLTRDASGNYTYQYVADQDAIADAEAELAEAENNLYNLDKDRAKSLTDEWYSIISEGQGKINEAIQSGDTERAENLYDYYFGNEGLLAGVKTELSYAESNLSKIGEELGGGDWVSSFSDFTSAITATGDNNPFTALQTSISNAINEYKDAKNLDTKDENDGVGSDLIETFSLLRSSIDTLDTNIPEVDTDQLDKLQSATENIMNSTSGLPALISILEPLKTELSGYANTYSQSIASKIDAGNNQALTANTNAINALTQSALQMIDMMDKEKDGKLNGESLGYSYNDETGLFDIDAN